MDNFENIYEKLSTFYYPHNISGEHKDLIGDRELETCIFCRRMMPEVTFKKEAHVIPAGLGNRTLFYLNECDSCNDVFSNYDNELINFLTFHRLFIRASKRPGTGRPKYKQKGKESAILSEANSNSLKIDILKGEGVFEIEEKHDENIVSLKVNNSPPYRLSDICKCLTHMAWALLRKEDKDSVSYVPE